MLCLGSNVTLPECWIIALKFVSNRWSISALMLFISVFSVLQLISRLLSSSLRSSLISCVRSARRRWRRAKTKIARAGKRRRSAVAYFNAKVPKKDLVNLSGPRTEPHKRQHQPAAHLRYKQLLTLPFLTCTCVFSSSKCPRMFVFFLHIYRMRHWKGLISFGGCQVTSSPFQLSLPVWGGNAM